MRDVFLVRVSESEECVGADLEASLMKIVVRGRGGEVNQMNICM